MTVLVEVGLDGGGSLLLEAAGTGVAGPVKAGRGSDAVHALHDSLREQLRPAAQASREMIEELRGTGPDDVTIEFGLKLVAGLGALVATSKAECHFKVTVRWSRDQLEAGSEDAP
ncbi:CU044_2847 family protein [Winogradskya humida]|uniref:Trypsin-co-occurring domain-containing protein n=1 Tax=Winogradskya humida TaxID=113566 RepID=A0ABQ4A104_9ACTN|nr:CU044_2847 family protein [Actinoplanes humidus]GIE24527.1 hypothetical protein Ahu01nite_076290 [Actinoplanes humidus]